MLPWLANFGYEAGRYSNPADTLLKMAHDPKLISSELDIMGLAQNQKQNYQGPGPEYDEFVKNTYNEDLTNNKNRK